MSSPIIKVENLSKLYRLGEVGTGTISHDINRWWAKVRGKEDPFEKVGELNNRTTKGGSDYVWSLRDINFEVQPGDVLGIVGRNGAGKSTLLKILSKTTLPTQGNIKIRGRIASLLEVGTGFHPELTGKENIFLNGAILGMTKAEVKKKFDEIVDFAGVERYIDTPVKRYSSGMYVRLAFAVAAFLEPEILIVDEVLAVGDAEFQKKCLGRMKDVSVNDGRTVLFVSHNMAAVRNLCTVGLSLSNGLVDKYGKIGEVIDSYMLSEKEANGDGNRVLNSIQDFSFTEWYLSDSSINKFSCYSRDTVKFNFVFQSQKRFEHAEFGFILRDINGEIVYGTNSKDGYEKLIQIEDGKSIFSVELRLPLRSGKYEVDIAFANEGKLLDHWKSLTMLTVVNNKESYLSENWTGALVELSKFDLQKTESVLI